MGEGHGVAQVEVGLAADAGSGLGGEVAAVDAVEDWGRAVGDVAVAVDAEEAVEVVLVVALRCELDDAVAIAFNGLHCFRYVVSVSS